MENILILFLFFIFLFISFTSLYRKLKQIHFIHLFLAFKKVVCYTVKKSIRKFDEREQVVFDMPSRESAAGGSGQAAECMKSSLRSNPNRRVRCAEVKPR